MKTQIRHILSLVFAAAMATTAYGQALPTAQSRWIPGADVGVVVSGLFTTDITNQTVQEGAGPAQGDTLPHQATTLSPSFVFMLRDQPKSWAGIELNYQYSKFSERYYLVAPGSPNPKGATNAVDFIPTSFHEATAAYMVHLMPGKKIRPYAAIGGGYLDFVPTNQLSNQWRGAGLVDLGVDVQTVSSLGFRFGARDLAYRAPNFGSSELSSSRWVSTEVTSKGAAGGCALAFSYKRDYARDM